MQFLWPGHSLKHKENTEQVAIQSAASSSPNKSGLWGKKINEVTQLKQSKHTTERAVAQPQYFLRE